MTFTHHVFQHGGHRHGGHLVTNQIRVDRLVGNPSHVPAGQLWGTTK
jgi:hypothetical protein